MVFTGEGCEGRMVSGKARLGLRQLGEGDLCIHSFMPQMYTEAGPRTLPSAGQIAGNEAQRCCLQGVCVIMEEDGQ